MKLNRDDRSKVAQRYLYLAYAVGGAGVLLGAWRGWLTPKSPWTTEGIPALLFVLILATYLVRGPTAFQPPNTYSGCHALLDLLKAGGCFLAMFAWVIATVRLVPDTWIGVAIVLGPAMAALVLGGVYAWRVMRFVTAGVIKPLSTWQPIADRTDGAAAPSGAVETSAQSLRVPLDYRAVVLRLVAGVSIMLVLWWILGRTRIDISVIALLTLIFVVYALARVLFGRGPALVIGPDGLSLRAGVGSVREMPWAEIAGFALRTNRLSSVLVIQMRDPESLIARQGAYRRWSMRQGLQMFGSPAYLSASFLRCDRRWLLDAATAYRTRYGAS